MTQLRTERDAAQKAVERLEARLMQADRHVHESETRSQQLTTELSETVERLTAEHEAAMAAEEEAAAQLRQCGRRDRRAAGGRGPTTGQASVS